MIQQELARMISANRDASVARVEAFRLEPDRARGDCNYFFCGAVADSSGCVTAIPNKYCHVLEIDPQTDKMQQWGDVPLCEGKGWTGGALAPDGCVYGFPRGANAVLKLDTRVHTLQTLPLNRVYTVEHHYGGALTSDGVAWMPPKYGNTVLAFDTRTGASWDVPLRGAGKARALFYGASADLNDHVYFFPAGRFSRAAMTDRNGRASFIGRPLLKAFFNSGTLAPDGDIYGFSSYGKGLLHIDTAAGRPHVLQRHFHGGFFGAKLAFNGKIYGVPGDSDEIAVFDPDLKKVVQCIPLPAVEPGAKAKCGGGCIDRFGNIWCVPAMGHYIYKIVFEGIQVQPSEELYQSRFFASTY